MSESPSLRVALESINETLGNPTQVLYSSGSLLAEYSNCSAAAVDVKLAALGAHIDQQIDIPHQSGTMAIRVGRLDDGVMFHVQVEADTGLGTARLYTPPSDYVLTDMWDLAQKMADAAFDTAGDRHQALLSYVSAKLLADPEHGRQLASDLTRIISDYLRAPASQIVGNARPQAQAGR